MDYMVKMLMDFAWKLDEYYRGDEHPDKLQEFVYEFLVEYNPDDPTQLRKPKKLHNGYFPPPWSMYDFPDQTEGWLAFQDALRKDPDYYLKFNSLNSMNKQEKESTNE